VNGQTMSLAFARLQPSLRPSLLRGCLLRCLPHQRAPRHPLQALRPHPLLIAGASVCRLLPSPYSVRVASSIKPIGVVRLSHKVSKTELHAWPCCAVRSPIQIYSKAELRQDMNHERRNARQTAPICFLTTSGTERQHTTRHAQLQVVTHLTTDRPHHKARRWHTHENV